MTVETKPADGAAQGRLLATLERLLAIHLTDVTETLGEASRLVAEAVGGEKAEVFLYDPADESLAAVGVTDTTLGRRERALGLDHLPLAEGGKVVEVFQTGEPYLIGHADKDAAELVDVVRDLAVRSTLLAPLQAEG